MFECGIEILDNTGGTFAYTSSLRYGTIQPDIYIYTWSPVGHNFACKLESCLEGPDRNDSSKR